MAVDDGLDLVESLVRCGCFGVFAGNEVFDGGAQGLGDAVARRNVGEAPVGVPPPVGAKWDAEAFSQVFLCGFLDFYELVYSLPKWSS